ncbi:MAG: chorismate synthase [Limnochordaceae bacterium]|nr:chorismate synthase [Limnochordaceae bacterium]
MGLRFLTAGESHGRALLAIVEGLPAGLPLHLDEIQRELARRQQGYGRGRRMQIEQDQVQVYAGLRHGQTLGSPLALLIENRDWPHWAEVMEPVEPPPAPPGRVLLRPRPGHADLAGGIKYGHRDLRNVLERASARETAARVAVGAVVRQLLSHFGVQICSCVTELGPVAADPSYWSYAGDPGRLRPCSDWAGAAEASAVRCPDPAATQAMMAAIDTARAQGDTLGGVFLVAAEGLPPGLGSYVHWDRRLDGRLAAALMSIPAIKGVEIGLGFAGARRPGSQVHDPIAFEGERYVRPTNRAGGLEGGVTNGQAVWLRAAMKPIATLYHPLPSVNIETHQAEEAGVERSDVCALPAAAVVGEAMVAWELAVAWQEKFGGDSLAEMEQNVQAYLRQVRGY